MKRAYMDGVFLLLRAVFVFLLVAGVAFAETPSKRRGCVVNEVIDEGRYSYIRCHQENNDVWLAIPRTRVTPGTRITYDEPAPMVNYRSKALGRTFERLYFATQVSFWGDTQSLSEAGSGGVDTVSASKDNDNNLYVGTDESGAVVFTDDPATAQKSKDIRRRVSSINNTTVLDNFSRQERNLVSMLEKALNSYCTFDIRSLKSVTWAAYWPTLQEGLQKEGPDRGAGFLRNFCFSEFRADTVKHFKATSDADGKEHTLADMKFIATKANGNSGDDEVCTASFIKVKNGWKFIDILCGAFRYN